MKIRKDHSTLPTLLLGARGSGKASLAGRRGGIRKTVLVTAGTAEVACPVHDGLKRKGLQTLQRWHFAAAVTDAHSSTRSSRSTDRQQT